MKAMFLENDSVSVFARLYPPAIRIHLNPKKKLRPMAFPCEQGPLPRLKENQQDHHGTAIKARQSSFLRKPNLRGTPFISHFKTKSPDTHMQVLFAGPHASGCCIFRELKD